MEKIHINHRHVVLHGIGPRFVPDSMPRRKDLGSSLRGLVRCPRHNKTFDLQTGESPGNCEILQTFRG